MRGFLFARFLAFVDGFFATIEIEFFLQGFCLATATLIRIRSAVPIPVTAVVLATSATGGGRLTLVFGAFLGSLALFRNHPQFRKIDFPIAGIE